MTQLSTRQDLYTRVTSRILAELDKGVRPWIKPRSVEYAAGRITRPLRHNGMPYLRQCAVALERGAGQGLRRTALDDV